MRRTSNKTYITTAILVLTVILAGALPAAALQAADHDSLAGTWVGEYALGATHIYFSAAFKGGDNNAAKWTGTARQPVLDDDLLRRRPPYVLNNVGLEGATASFSLPVSAGVLGFKGEMVDGTIKGTVQKDGSDAGTFELVHIVSIRTSEFQPLTGDYELPSGKTLVIGRTLTALYYLDETDNSTGPLLARDSRRFFGGPALGIHFPPSLELRFSSDTVEVRRQGASPIIAKKVISYELQDVAFRSGSVTLAGTVRAPLTHGRHPAVLMLHGSNAQSRYGQDALIDFNADHLARRGFVVLSYDKRGVGQSTGTAEDLGLEDDGAAALKLLSARNDVDSQRVGIWGISQGGILAPKVAALTGQVAFIVSVSGAVVHGHQQEMERTEQQMRADGFQESDIREAVELQRLKFHYAETGEGWQEYVNAVKRAEGKAWLPDPYIGPPTSQDSPAWAVWRQGAGSMSPAQYWQKFRGKVLLIYGDKETYSNPKTNIAEFESAMRRAGNTQFTVAQLDRTEHAMRQASTGGAKELPLLHCFSRSYWQVLDQFLDRILRPSSKRSE